MVKQKSLGLTKKEQIESFEEALELVEDDFDKDMTYGEVVKVLSDAYTGSL